MPEHWAGHKSTDQKRADRPELDPDDHAGLIKAAKEVPLNRKWAHWELLPHRQQPRIISAINNYMQSGEFILEAHIEAVHALSSQAFADLPLPPLLHALWDDLAQPHIFEARCIPAASSYIAAVCRRVYEQANERRGLLQDLKEIELRKVTELLEDERPDQRARKDRQPEWLRDKLAALDAEPKVQPAMEAFRFITSIGRNGYSKGHTGYENRVEPMLIKAASFLGDMPAIFAVLNVMRQNEKPIDSLVYFRIAAACLRARDVASAEANYNAFVAAIARGDLPEESNMDATDIDQGDELNSNFELKHSPLKILSRRRQVMAMLLETYYLAGEVERGDVMWKEMKESGQPLTGAQVAGYLRGKRAVLDPKLWTKELQACLYDDKTSVARDDRRFYQSIFQMLLEEEPPDPVALSFVYVYSLSAQNIPIAWRMSHLGTILEYFIHKFLTCQEDKAKPHGPTRNAKRLWMKTAHICAALDRKERGLLAPPFGITRRLVIAMAQRGNPVLASLIARTYAGWIMDILEETRPEHRAQQLHNANTLLLYALGDDVAVIERRIPEMENFQATIMVLFNLQSAGRKFAVSDFAVAITPQVAALKNRRRKPSLEVIWYSFRKLLGSVDIRENLLRPVRRPPRLPATETQTVETG